MPNPVDMIASPSPMPAPPHKLSGKWTASTPTPPSPPIKASTSIKAVPSFPSPPAAPSHKPITLYTTAAGIDVDEMSVLSLPESKFLLDPQPSTSIAHATVQSLSVASPTLTAAQPTATPEAITSPPSSTPTSPLSASTPYLSAPSPLPARPSSPPAPLSSLSLSTLSSLSLSHRQRWRPHPQLFRVDEETNETEDEHWQRLCQQYSMTASFHYVHTSLSNTPQASRPPSPTLASLLSPTFVSCTTTGYKCQVVRQLPRLSSSCQLSVDWQPDRPMLRFGSQALPLTAVYAVTTPASSSPPSSSSPASSTSPLTLSLHLPLRLLQLSFQTPHEHTFFHTQFSRLIHHINTTLSPVANLTYEPTTFLQLAQQGQPARRYIKRANGDMAVECGIVSVELSKGEVRWSSDGKDEVVQERRGGLLRRWWSGGRREERRQCVVSLLDDVRAVMAGRHTKVWMRNEQQQKEAGQPVVSADQCFSIVTDECTMDIELASGRNVWVRGLLDLIDVLREARVEEERVRSHRRAKSAAKLSASKQPTVLQSTDGAQSSLPQRNSLTLPLPSSSSSASSTHHGSFRAKREEMAAKRAEQQAAAQQRLQEAESKKSGSSLAGASSRRGSGSASLGGWLGAGSSEGSECEESDVGMDDWSDFDMSAVVTRPRSRSEAAPLPKSLLPLNR